MPEPRKSDLHVLTLTPFYPSSEDERGGYVAEPLEVLTSLGMHSSVLAVRPFYKERVVVADMAPFATWMRYPAWPGNQGLAAAGRGLFWRVRNWVRRLHHETPIHAFHAHAALPCGEAARLLSEELGIPSVVTVHGLDAYLTRQVSGSAGQRCAGACHRVYESAARVVCISEEVRRQVVSGNPGLRTTEVVYNGVDAEVFTPPKNRPGDPVVASIGSLIPIKGHDVTLRAVADLTAEFPNLRLRIIGEGEELGRLQALARELGISERTEFLGRRTREEVADVLRKSHIFALPSRFEGLGVAYLEAMSCGLPVIAYRGQGIQEVIGHNESGILMVEPATGKAHSALAAVLRTLLKNPEMRESMGNAARRAVIGGYTLRHQADGLLGVFERARSLP